jgi:V8-like Glu-specific endopeptidase
VTGEQSIYRFNFQNAWDGSALPVKEYRAKSGGLFVQDETLDFTLIELDGEPGAQWSWVPLVPGKVAVDERINIIQHPGGQAKQIAMQSNLVEYVDARVTQYVTTTMPGSSGSPAFNDTWEIGALHHAGGTLPEASTGSRHYRNEGILVAAIVAALEANVRERVTTPIK